MSKYLVIRDTREQCGWEFAPTENCAGMVDEKLPTGDYTIRGYENLLTIERKGSIAEFAKNIVQGRFEAELIRMESFAFPFMVLEFSMDDIKRFPVGSGIPEGVWKKMRVTRFFILKRLIEFELQYKTKIIFASSFGKETAASIFKRVIEQCPVIIKQNS